MEPKLPLSQLYRGELARADRAHSRLDSTTHWALATSIALAVAAWASPTTPAGTLLAGVASALWFLLLEARRYRYYDASVHRLRLLEGGYWAPALRDEAADPDALKELALDLARPQLRLSLPSALARRVRATYGLLLLGLLGAWYAKIHLHPVPAHRFVEELERARMGAVPGAVVFAIVAALACVLLLFYVASWLMHAPAEELRPRPGVPLLFPLRASLRRWAAIARRRVEPPE
jgi:uncharacterized membrane protein